MIPQLDKLVRIYARHGVTGVQACDEFTNLVAEHENFDEFNAQRMVVARAQSRLETMVSVQLSFREQVIQSLKEIRRVRADTSRLLIYRRLVLHGYAQAWSPGQRAYFEEVCEILAEWHDFFLSFTSHNAAKPDINFVNQDHSLLLGVGVGLMLQRPEAVEQNLLARYLHGRLVDGGYRGYYYPHDVDPRTVVGKLADEAMRSLAFVQLLQRSMFRRYPDNYCLMEFGAAISNESRVLVFVMCEAREEFLAMNDVPDELADWYGSAMSHPAIVLRPATTVGEVNATVATIKKELMGRIEVAHTQLLRCVPSD